MGVGVGGRGGGCGVGVGVGVGVSPFISLRLLLRVNLSDLSFSGLVQF